MIQEFLPSISWSLVGFVIGWLVGRELLFISQIREAVVPEKEREATDHKMPVRSSKLLGYIVVILAVLSVLQGSYYTLETQKTSQCQAQYNADFAKVLRQRAAWAEEDKAAEIKLFKDLLGAQPGQGKTLLEDYLATSARTDRLRTENPLPKLEDRNC